MRIARRFFFWVAFLCGLHKMTVPAQQHATGAIMYSDLLSVENVKYAVYMWYMLIHFTVYCGQSALSMRGWRIKKHEDLRLSEWGLDLLSHRSIGPWKSRFQKENWGESLDAPDFAMASKQRLAQLPREVSYHIGSPESRNNHSSIH